MNGAVEKGLTKLLILPFLLNWMMDLGNSPLYRKII